MCTTKMIVGDKSSSPIMSRSLRKRWVVPVYVCCNRWPRVSFYAYELFKAISADGEKIILASIIVGVASNMMH
jgi:hypothetical protein